MDKFLILRERGAEVERVGKENETEICGEQRG